MVVPRSELRSWRRRERKDVGNIAASGHCAGLS